MAHVLTFVKDSFRLTDKTKPKMVSLTTKGGLDEIWEVRALALLAIVVVESHGALDSLPWAVHHAKCYRLIVDICLDFL